jgi:hypothetical protein
MSCRKSSPLLNITYTGGACGSALLNTSHSGNFLLSIYLHLLTRRPDTSTRGFNGSWNLGGSFTFSNSCVDLFVMTSVMTYHVTLTSITHSHSHIHIIHEQFTEMRISRLSVSFKWLGLMRFATRTRCFSASFCFCSSAM